MMHEPMNIKFTVYNLQFTVSYNLLSVTCNTTGWIPFFFFSTFCWPRIVICPYNTNHRASWYVRIIWTNKMHHFLLIYFNNKPVHVSSRLAAHHQEHQLASNSEFSASNKQDASGWRIQHSLFSGQSFNKSSEGTEVQYSTVQCSFHTKEVIKWKIYYSRTGKTMKGCQKQNSTSETKHQHS